MPHGGAGGSRAEGGADGHDPSLLVVVIAVLSSADMCTAPLTPRRQPIIDRGLEPQRVKIGSSQHVHGTPHNVISAVASHRLKRRVHVLERAVGRRDHNTVADAVDCGLEDGEDMAVVEGRLERQELGAQQGGELGGEYATISPCVEAMVGSILPGLGVVNHANDDRMVGDGLWDERGVFGRLPTGGLRPRRRLRRRRRHHAGQSAAQRPGAADSPHSTRHRALHA
mmetsp:Transcript_55230/g.175684  ORF Transcript_55230/g.175684 Transcript_55230/m.175684 type:complete len:226 (-) Transcript_55230:2802-3479(-)